MNQITPSNPPPPPTAPGGHMLTLGEIWIMVWRWRYRAAIAGVIAAAAVLAYTFRITPIYEARGELILEGGSKAVNFAGDQGGGENGFAFLSTERDRLLSQPVMQRTLERAHLLDKSPYRDSRNPTGMLASKITIGIQRTSSIISVRLTDQDPVEAERLLGIYFEVCLEWQREQQAKRAQGVLEFLYKQIDERRTRLQQMRDDEIVFRNEHGILSADPDNNRFSLRLRNLTADLHRLQREMSAVSALASQISAAEAKPAGEARTTALLRIERVQNHLVVGKQLSDLYHRLDEQVLLSQKYGPKHPRIIEIGEQIKTKRQQLEEAIELVVEGVRTNVRELQLQVTGVEEQIEVVQTQQAAYREALNGLRVRSQEIATEESLLAVLLRRQAESEVSSRLDGTYIQVLEPPQRSFVPINIKRKVFVIAAALAGAVAAIATGLGFGFFDKRVRTLEQLQHCTTLALWGHLPLVQRLAKTWGQAPLPFLLPEMNVYLQNVWARISLASGERSGPRAMLMTSAQPGDGKTTSLVSLALYLAGLDRKVLIIDADLRRPAVHKSFHRELGVGLGGVIDGEDPNEAIEEMAPNLFMLNAGRARQDPASLLRAERFGEVLQSLRESYDHVLIDCPPLTVSADVLLILEHVTAAAMVVRAQRTQRNELQQTAGYLQRFEQAGNTAGVIFNGVRQAGNQYDYGPGSLSA